MSYAVVPDTEAAYGFCSEFFPVGRTDDMKGICLERDGKLIAAVLYDQFNGQNVFMNVAAVAGKNWLNKHFLHEAFKHPFVTLGVGRITLWIDATNIPSRRFALKLGFTEEAKLRGAARDGTDVVLYRMFREECRYA
jgi:RimJ/RimL family protein N-acetyltransferase